MRLHRTAAQEDPEAVEQAFAAASPTYADLKQKYDRSRKTVTRTGARWRGCAAPGSADAPCALSSLDAVVLLCCKQKCLRGLPDRMQTHQEMLIVSTLNAVAHPVVCPRCCCRVILCRQGAALSRPNQFALSVRRLRGGLHHVLHQADRHEDGRQVQRQRLLAVHAAGQCQAVTFGVLGGLSGLGLCCTRAAEARILV